MHYETFILRFESGTGAVFDFSVESPAGEAAGRCDLARFLSLSPLLSTLASASMTRHFRPAGSREVALELEQVGRELFEEVFRGEVGERFRESLVGVRSRGLGLRLQVELDPRRKPLARLLEVPWELLADPADEHPFALGRETPIVRYLALPKPPGSIALPRPLRILALAAQGSGPTLDLDRERRHLEQACRGLEAVALEWVDPPTLAEMRRRLLGREFHVFHFMGHGRFDRESGEGKLFLGGGDSPNEPVGALHFAETLRGFPSLRLVVLNACQTALADVRSEGRPFEGVASGLMMGGIPAALAMRAPIGDRAAIAFSKAFYERLASGAPVEAGVTEGRLAIRQLGGGGFEWAIPTLFSRSRTGRIFASRRHRGLLAALLLALGLVGWTAWGSWRDHQVETLLKQAAVWIEAGTRSADARKALEEVLEREGDHAPSHALLAELDEGEGRYAEALGHLETALRLQPDHAPYHLERGYLLQTLARPEEARESLLRALELDPAYAQAANELGNAERQLGRLPEAREAYGRALKLAQAQEASAPELAPIWKNVGRATLEAGEPQSAIEPLEKALASYDLKTSQARQGMAEANYLLALARAELEQESAACTAVQGYRHADDLGLWEWSDDLERLATELECDG